MNTLTWYGHAAIGLKTSDAQLIIDPFFTGNPAASTSADKIDTDYILISHGHGDHVGDALELARRTKAKVIANAEIVNWIKKQNYENVHAQHLGGGFKHPFGYLKLTLALHGSQMPDGSYGGNPCGFLLTCNDGKKIYMAQDTGLFGDMALIGEEGIDVALIPIGDNFTMGPVDALRAVKLLKPNVVIPIHYSTWGLIEQDPITWGKQVMEETDTKAVVLNAGETFDF